MGPAPEINQLTWKVIGCAIAVHKALGPGFAGVGVPRVPDRRTASAGAARRNKRVRAGRLSR